MLYSTKVFLHFLVLVFGLSYLVSAQECNSNTGVCENHEYPVSGHESGICVDKHENCGFWAERYECLNNPSYMLRNCPKSCKVCDKLTVGRDATTSDEKRKLAESAEYLIEQSANFGEVQVAEGKEKELVLQHLRETIRYMNSEQVTQLPPEIQDMCKNKYNLCTFWSQTGECEKNKLFMEPNCGPACQVCELHDLNFRCPKLENPTPALQPGDLHKMFERIVSKAPGNRTDLTPHDLEELQQTKTPMYTVHVHSRSFLPVKGEASIFTEQFSNPWLVTFDNFLTDAECEAIIQAGYKDGFERSMKVGKIKQDGSIAPEVSESRTSESAWCTDLKDGCRSQEVPKRIHERITRVLGIPVNNTENIQILKYEKGQYYETHHDYIPIQRERQCGPRILTFFLYLNDVPEGGETDFPKLGITIKPKKGRAVLWPSVFSSDPILKDVKTVHQSLPVIKGTKFAANVWVHLYDWYTPAYQNCV